jgi:hypothetical protein
MKGRVSFKDHYADVVICERWVNSYAVFKEDMGECPSNDYFIERKDNSKGYEPSNCRWATKKEQARNRCTNVFVEDDEGQRLIAKDYAAKYGIGYDGLLRRLRAGQSAAEARTEMRRRRERCCNLVR